MKALKTLAVAIGLALTLGAATPAQAHGHHWRHSNHYVYYRSYPHYTYYRPYPRPYYSYYRPAVVYDDPYAYDYDDYSYPRYYAGPRFGLTFAFGGHHWRHHHHHHHW